MKPIRLLHFADAHIDIANYGQYDLQTYLPVRVMDFLHALDQIVNRAIEEQVDLVIFAGDAYKDRNPHPTFQREWGKRIIRLSKAKIPTILLVGNHDVSPAAGRAHALQEFATLDIPYIFLGERIHLFTPEELGVPIQVITVPWLSRSALIAHDESIGRAQNDVIEALENRAMAAIAQLISQSNPDLPLILTAHTSIVGASFGSERAVMLGHELVLGNQFVMDKRLDYVALGHIHKHQNLNAGNNPPIIYPGSIERIDFGEKNEEKGYVLATISRGHTQWEFVKLKTRPFREAEPITNNPDTFMADILAQLPPAHSVKEAIWRVILTYPRDWEPLLNEAVIAERFKEALQYHLVKRPINESRVRLGDTVAVESLTPAQLLDQYWKSKNLDPQEIEALQLLAKETFVGLDIT